VQDQRVAAAPVVLADLAERARDPIELGLGRAELELERSVDEVGLDEGPKVLDLDDVRHPSPLRLRLRSGLGWRCRARSTRLVQRGTRERLVTRRSA